MSLLPKPEFNRLRSAVFNGLANVDLLNVFDMKFLLDYRERFDVYQRHAHVSDAQEAVFNRIEDYLREELGSDYIETE